MLRTTLLMIAAFSVGVAAHWVWTHLRTSRLAALNPGKNRHETRRQPYWLQTRLSRLKAALKFTLGRPGHVDHLAFTGIDTQQIPWSGSESDSYQTKKLLVDPETGMRLMLVRYPAGSVTAKHIHPCGHGMYVLEGVLDTDKGSFPPRSFVWFPEGESMEHGASTEGDLVVLFLNNKPFDLSYVE
jgi:quercetin dioxygenase-like cupin family protein